MKKMFLILFVLVLGVSGVIMAQPVHHGPPLPGNQKHHGTHSHQHFGGGCC